MNLIDFHMHPYLTGSQYTGMYLEPGPESGKNVMDKIRCDMERAGISHVRICNWRGKHSLEGILP